MARPRDALPRSLSFQCTPDGQLRGLIQPGGTIPHFDAAHTNVKRLLPDISVLHGAAILLVALTLLMWYVLTVQRTPGCRRT